MLAKRTIVVAESGAGVEFLNAVPSWTDFPVPFLHAPRELVEDCALHVAFLGCLACSKVEMPFPPAVVETSVHSTSLPRQAIHHRSHGIRPPILELIFAGNSTSSSWEEGATRILISLGLGASLSPNGERTPSAPAGGESGR